MASTSFVRFFFCVSDDHLDTNMRNLKSDHWHTKAIQCWMTIIQVHSSTHSARNDCWATTTMLENKRALISQSERLEQHSFWMQQGHTHTVQLPSVCRNDCQGSSSSLLHYTLISGKQQQSHQDLIGMSFVREHITKIEKRKIMSKYNIMGQKDSLSWSRWGAHSWSSGNCAKKTFQKRAPLLFLIIRRNVSSKAKEKRVTFEPMGLPNSWDLASRPE